MNSDIFIAVSLVASGIYEWAVHSLSPTKTVAANAVQSIQVAVRSDDCGRGNQPCLLGLNGRGYVLRTVL
jgi:hypothetical protein